MGSCEDQMRTPYIRFLAYCLAYGKTSTICHCPQVTVYISWGLGGATCQALCRVLRTMRCTQTAPACSQGVYQLDKQKPLFQNSQEKEKVVCDTCTSRILTYYYHLWELPPPVTDEAWVGELLTTWMGNPLRGTHITHFQVLSWTFSLNAIY